MLTAKLERERAGYVIEKAQSHGTPVMETMLGHQVSKTLIAELIGEIPTTEKRVREDKDAKLREWVLAHLGEETSPWQLSKGLEVSYDTALSIVKNNVDYFVKVKKGIYTIRDGRAEREEAKSTK
jgi:hypothetical protein